RHTVFGVGSGKANSVEGLVDVGTAEVTPVEPTTRVPHQIGTEQCRSADERKEHGLVIALAEPFDELFLRNLLQRHIHSNGFELAFDLERDPFVERIWRDQAGEVNPRGGLRRATSLALEGLRRGSPGPSASTWHA